MDDTESDDPTVSSLLSMAEFFLSQSPQKITESVKCLLAALAQHPPPRMEAKARLQLGLLLFHHTNNLIEAREHLDKAILISQSVANLETIRFEATSTSAHILVEQKCFHQAKSLLRSKLDSSVHFPYWHLRLLLQLADVCVCERDESATVSTLDRCVEYARQVDAQYARLLCSLYKGVFLLTHHQYHEAEVVLNETSVQLETYHGEKEVMIKTFFLVVQVAHLLIAGQVKAAKPHLKQLQHQVKSLSTEVTVDATTTSLTANSIQWLSKEQTFVIVYLVSVMHSVQGGYTEKALTYADKAMQFMSDQPETGVVSVLKAHLLEHIILCLLMQGKTSNSVEKLPDVVAVCHGHSQLVFTHRAVLHTLLGLYAFATENLDKAISQFHTALQHTNNADLRVYISINLAITFMKCGEERAPELAALMSSLESENVTISSQSLRAAVNYVKGLHSFTMVKYHDAKRHLRETLLMSNKSDLNKLTTCALILLGQIFLSVGNTKETMDMVSPAMQLASKIPDKKLQVWSASLLADLYHFNGDQKSELTTREQSKQLAKELQSDQSQAVQSPHHNLVQWTVGEWPVTKPKKPPIPLNDILSSSSSLKAPPKSCTKPHPQVTSSRGDFPNGADSTKYHHQKEQGMTTSPFGSPLHMSKNMINERLDGSQLPQASGRDVTNPYGSLRRGEVNERTSSFEKHTASPSSNSPAGTQLGSSQKQYHQHPPLKKNLELKLHDTISGTPTQRNSPFSQHSQSPSRMEHNTSSSNMATSYSPSLRNSQLTNSPIGNKTPEIHLTKITTPTATNAPSSSISHIPQQLPPAYNSTLEKSRVDDSNYSPPHRTHHVRQQHHNQSHTRVEPSHSHPVAANTLSSSHFQSGSSAFQPVVTPQHQTDQHMDTASPQNALNFQHSFSSPPVGAHPTSSRLTHQKSPQQHRLSPAPSQVAAGGSGGLHPAMNSSPPMIPQRRASPHTPPRSQTTQLHQSLSPQTQASHSPLHHQQQIGTPPNPHQSQQPVPSIHHEAITGSPAGSLQQHGSGVPHHLSMLQQRQQDSLQQFQQQQKQQLALAQRALGQTQYGTSPQMAQPSFNQQHRQALLQQQVLQQHQQQQQRLLQLQQAQMQQAQQFIQQRNSPTPQALSHSPGSAYLQAGVPPYYQAMNSQLLQQQQQQLSGGGVTNKSHLPPHPQLTHISTLQRLGQESNRGAVGGGSNPPMMMSLNPYAYHGGGEGMQLLPNGANFPAALQQTNQTVSPLRHFNHVCEPDVHQSEIHSFLHRFLQQQQQCSAYLLEVISVSLIMSLAPSDVVVGWQQLAQINMKAREQQVSSNQELTTATTNHISIANLPTVGYNSSNVATTKRTRANNSDVIIVSDEDSPSPDGQQQPANELHALRELLHQEEKKLSMLKTIRGLQSTTVATNGNSTGKIQGSALNKTTGRSSPNITLSRRDISGSGGTRAIQPKHSIVVVPGNHQLNATPSTASMSSGISSRLQQLVDTIAVDQALNSSQIKSTRNLKANSVTTWSQQGRQVSTTPPVPGLTSISPTPAIKPPSISLINDTLLNLTSSSIPPLRPKLTSSVHRPAHEIITISDSPGSKNPPPLLSTNVGPITVPTATARGLIQIPTISSTSGSKMLRELALSKPTSEKEMRESIESSRRYREYVIKQSTAKKNFQKQMDRKMLLAPYPKTFRQVWPVIPVHDPAFISNFGLEEVTHFFESNLKGPQDRTNTTAKVKPICNQCGCDFASAWQIRKSNSKQLLLCESCDFQNLKILQRQKLANQLKDLLDSIKKEEEKFSSECEEAKKQVVALEKQSYERLPTANSSVTRNPPPLTSQLHGTQPTKHSTFTPTIVNGNQVTKHQFESVKSTSSNVTSKPTSTTVISIHPKAVIPSILGQTSVSKATDDVRSNSRKRKEPLVSATPPSKAYKPGSTLDVTLNKLSQQLINRKLNEKRQEAGQVPEDGHNKEEAVVDQSPPPPATAVIVNNGGSESRRNRRKGKPRHKRHLSASSATSE